MGSSATTILLFLFIVLAVTTTARQCKTIFLTTFTNPSPSFHDHLAVSSIVGSLSFAVGCAVVLYSIWYIFSRAYIYSRDDDVSVLNNNKNGYIALASSTNNNLNYNNQQPDSDEPSGDHNEAATFEWTPQLHKRFVYAVALLGIKNAQPKTIMQLMSVDGLTRENVASHLQNYRLYLKRLQSLPVSSGDPSADHLSAGSG